MSFQNDVSRSVMEKLAGMGSDRIGNILEAVKNRLSRQISATSDLGGFIGKTSPTITGGGRAISPIASKDQVLRVLGKLPQELSSYLTEPHITHPHPRFERVLNMLSPGSSLMPAETEMANALKTKFGL